MNDQQYETDQRIRAAVRKAIDAVSYRRGAVPHAVIADDALDALELLTLKTEDGRFVKVEPVAGWDVNPKGEGPVRIFYRIVEDPAQ